MTTTYSGNPSSSLKDETRFLLGDTESPWLVTDEEIAFALTRAGQLPGAAAALLARSRGAVLVRRGAISIDGISVDFGGRGRALLELAELLDREARGTPQAGVPAFAGGISQSVDETLKTEDDYPSVFSKLDYPV